jgi:hypothetical protein
LEDASFLISFNVQTLEDASFLISFLLWNLIYKEQRTESTRWGE